MSISADRASRFRELQDHSLRLSDVGPFRRKAAGFSERLLLEPSYGQALQIAEFGLGDPIRYGFRPPLSLHQMLRDAIEFDPNYTESVGLPRLTEELRYRGHRIVDDGQRVSTYHLDEKDAFVFTGPGSSGVVRAYMGIVAGGKKHKAVVFVPELTYPLFLAEAAYVEADVITVPIDPKTGVVNPDILKSVMQRTIEEYGTDIRYILVGTTIGNPLGSAMSKDTFNEITNVLNFLNSHFNIRIHRITDPTYERFRRKQELGFDPVVEIMEHSSTAVELVTGTFSKSECWPGKRVGYGLLLTDTNGFAREYGERLDTFRDMAFGHVDAAYAITLGTVDIHNQIAVARWLHELRTNPIALHEEETRQTAMRSTVNLYVAQFAQALLSIPGVELHPYCLTEGGQVDLDKLHSFYVLWRFNYERNGLSQAARLSGWTLHRAMEEICADAHQTTPVVFKSDGDMFFAKSHREQVQQFIRTVALRDKHAMQHTLQLIEEFASIVVKTGQPPPYVEAKYPFS